MAPSWLRCAGSMGGRVAKAAKKAAKAKKARKPRKPKAIGRPTTYSLKVAGAICERLVEGQSLRAICKDEAMPGLSTVFQWLAAHHEFADLYARAREEQAETLAAEIVEIADEQCTMVRADKHSSRDDDGGGNTEVVFDSAAVARNRLRVDARKWVAAKLKPRVYGDKVQLADADGNKLPPAPQFIVGPVTALVKPEPVEE